MFEVTSTGTVVWSYNRGGEIARAVRYGLEFSGVHMITADDIVINEFMAENDSINDPSGESDDWIELYNNTDSVIELSGRYLSDNSTSLNKWRFPLNTIIEPHGYLIVWADNNTTQPGLHANFDLAVEGEKIILSNFDLTIIDSVHYNQQVVNKSYSRIPNGTGNFVISNPTFGNINSNLPVNLLPGSVVMNEYMAINDTIPDPNNEFEDWIEFYNNTTSTIDLTGKYLSDDELVPLKWQFPEGTTIGSNEYLIVWADNDLTQTGIHTNFEISNTGGKLFFSNADFSVIDTSMFGMQIINKSYARIPNGTGTFSIVKPTIGSINKAPIPNILQGVVVINEFMAENDSIADPAGEFEDWIEIYNNTAEPIDLTDKYLSDDNSTHLKWKFPDGTILPANGYLIIWADEDLTQEGLHSNFKISTGGETLIFSNDDLSVIDTISFEEQIANVSLARIPNGTGNFIKALASFNGPNVTVYVSINETENTLSGFSLGQNFPNPFNPATNINFSTDKDGFVSLKIYNMLGELVSEVINGELNKGNYKITFDASGLPSGTYLYRLSSFDKSIVKKFILMK